MAMKKQMPMEMPMKDGMEGMDMPMKGGEMKMEGHGGHGMTHADIDHPSNWETLKTVKYRPLALTAHKLLCFCG